jgi:hypothetical protein
MELLGHSVELFEQKNAKKNKFAVLHLANAVELLLKDMVIDFGGSIFENNGKSTINIWSAFKALESYGMTFPKKPQIEILIDDRNVIQHKFGYPSEESVVYYLDIGIDLFRDCISQWYGTDFDDIAPSYFSQSGLVLVGVNPKSDLAKADAIAKYDALSGVAMAYGVLEAKVSQLLGHKTDARPIMIWHDPRFYKLLKELKAEDLDGQKPKAYFDSIRQLRNVAVHRQHHDTGSMEPLMREGLLKIKKLVAAIEAVPEAKI